MIPLHLSEIAELTGGTLHGADALVEAAVVTDSREATPGSLYVARIGEHSDGHDFAAAAAHAGAVGVLGSRVVAGMPSVVVADVQEAFARVARGVVDRCPQLRIVGITGSSGKTSTKDLLGAVLQSAGETISPVGSLNSEVGVPLTVCRITAQTQFLVAEMGASGVGHIAYLTHIAPPSIAIVLNVGSAHLGEFGSVDAIARTKAELVQALPPQGLAILNADDERVAAMRTLTAARVVTVGLSDDADVRAHGIRLDAAGRASFQVDGLDPQGTREVSLAVHGEHQVGNALAVLVAARELGKSPSDAIAAIASAGPVSRWRMEVHELPNNVLLVNDAYNANPDSMRAALRALSHLAAGRRAVAVLGEMRELGEESEAAHRSIGEYAGEVGVQHLIAVAQGAQEIAAGARSAGVALVNEVTDAEAAHALLRSSTRPGDVLLLKSSRDSGLRYLGDRIATESGVEVGS